MKLWLKATIIILLLGVIIMSLIGVIIAPTQLAELRNDLAKSNTLYCLNIMRLKMTFMFYGITWIKRIIP